MMLVVLLFCAPAFLSQSISILEYPYVLLVASLYMSAVFGNPNNYDKRQIYGSALTAQMAVVPEVPNSSGFLNLWPEFKDQLSKWGVVVFKGRYFTVYRRSAARAAASY
jgi:hypothetical protein